MGWHRYFTDRGQRTAAQHLRAELDAWGIELPFTVTDQQLLEGTMSILVQALSFGVTMEEANNALRIMLAHSPEEASTPRSG